MKFHDKEFLDAAREAVDAVKKMFNKPTLAISFLCFILVVAMQEAGMEEIDRTLASEMFGEGNKYRITVKKEE